MPNIFKQQGFYKMGGPVRIPSGDEPDSDESDSEESKEEVDSEESDLIKEEGDTAEEPLSEEYMMNNFSESKYQAPLATQFERVFETSPKVVPEPVIEQEVILPVALTYDEVEALNRGLLDKICNEARKEAQEEAYYDALNRKKAEIRECIEKVDKNLLEMQKLQIRYMEQYANELKYIAIEIAEKIIITKIKNDDLILTKLIMQTVSSVKNSSWLDVEISEHLVSLVEYMKQELAKPEYHGRATVTPLACADDTCRVSTEDGTVVSTISVQAENLRKSFRTAEEP